MRMPSMESSFRNLHRNERIEAVSQFVSASVWKDNGAAPGDMDGATVTGALDLAASHDLTAAVFIGEDGSVWPHCWLPQEGLAEKARLDKNPYDVWAREGWLLTTPGKAIDFDFVAAFLREVFDRCTVKAIAFDRVYMRFLRPALVRAGFAEAELELFIEFGQGFISMGPAIRELEVRLLEKKLKHGNHPVLTMCAANAAVITDDAGNRKFTKKRSTGRIDALVALAMAVAVQPPVIEQPTFSVFVIG